MYGRWTDRYTNKEKRKKEEGWKKDLYSIYCYVRLQKGERKKMCFDLHMKVTRKKKIMLERGKTQKVCVCVCVCVREREKGRKTKFLCLFEFKRYKVEVQY